MKESEVVYALAHTAPATVKEIEKFLNTETNAHNGTVLRTWRDGLLIRRKRERGGMGKDPYEYTLRPAEDM